MKISNQSFPGSVAVVNNPSSNHCICGSAFDNSGICNNMHIQGNVYHVPKNTMKNRKTKTTVKRDRSFNICKPQFQRVH